MAQRNDVTVNQLLSPRIAEITSSSNEITVQDSHDTLIRIEDLPSHKSFKKLVDTAGKENLGGGVEVGLTSTLQNLQYAPQRTSPRESGTVTTADTDGLVLIDSTATFQTNNVARGDWVYNQTDGSVTEVLTVDSEIQLTCRALSGGTDNQFGLTDSYKVWEVSTFSMSGGNFVAVDSAEASIDPFFTSFGRTVALTASSSATAIDFNEQVQDLADRIESLRRTHPGFGTVYYWDPQNGDDAKDGLLRDTAVQTWSAVHALLSAGDIVVGIAPSSGFVVDQINVTKKNIHIRCPGDNFWIKPSTDVVPVIFNDADYSSIEGVRISKATAGSANGINIIDSDRVLIHEVNIHQETGDSVYISGSYMVHLQNSWFHGCTGNGITGVTGCDHLRVENCFISNNGGDGINLTGTTIKSCQVGWNTKIQFSGGWGINLGADPRRIAIDSSVIMANNTSGDVNYIAANQVNFAREIENAPVANLQNHIEALRQSHHATGNNWYLDPTKGSNSKDGTTEATAFATWAYTETFLGTGDVVNLVADPAAATTVLAERIVSTKSNFHIRGPGDHFHVHPINGDPGSVVALGTTGTHSTGVSMQGFAIHTSDPTATNNGIEMFGDQNKFSSLIIDDVPGDGFKSADCSNTLLENVQILNAGDQGVHITNCQYLTIKDCFIDSSTLAAVRIDGNGNGDSSNTDLINNVIKDVPVGIHIWAGTTSARIRASNRFIGTVPTQVNDDGTDTHIESTINNSGIWENSLTEAYPVDGQSAQTPTAMLYAINQMLSEFARTGTIVSIKKRDGTEAFQLTLDSATAPTSSTQSS